MDPAAAAPLPPGESDKPDIWVDLAVAEGRRALDQQREELNSMRTRAVAFSALTVSASAFLVGSGLKDATRNGWFFCLAGFGTAAFIAVAVLLVLMVVPRIKFRFFIQPDLLFAWTEGEQRAPSKAIAMRALAKTLIPDMIRDNDIALGKVRRLYRLLLIAGIVSIAFWVMIVWIFA